MACTSPTVRDRLGHGGIPESGKDGEREELASFMWSPRSWVAAVSDLLP